MFGILMVILIVISLGFIFIGVEMFEDVLVSTGLVGVLLFGLLSLASVILSDKAKTTIVSSTEIKIEKIAQQQDGKYVVITASYEKIEPKVQIVSSNSKLVKNKLKQVNPIADFMASDKEEIILCLNLQDVSSVSSPRLSATQ